MASMVLAHEEILRGTGKDGNLGIVGDLAQIKTYLKIAIAILAIGTVSVVGYISLNLAKVGMGVPVVDKP